MILAPLPGKGKTASGNSDSILHAQKLRSSYKYTLHNTRMGVLSSLNGVVQYLVNDQHCEITHGTYTVISPGSNLRVESAAHSVPFLLFFHPKLLFGSEEIDLSIIERLHLSGQALSLLFRELYRLSTSSASFYALKSDALVRSIYQVIHQQARRASLYSNNLPVSKASTRLDLFRRLDYTREWMQLHFSDATLSIKEMANLAGMNYHHYLRMFTHAFGISPNQYLINTRLDKAKELLTSTSQPISSICTTVGYQSVGSFGWLFKNRFGISPSACRRQSKILTFR